MSDDTDDRKTLTSPPPEGCDDEPRPHPDDAPECSPPASGVYRIRGA